MTESTNGFPRSNEENLYVTKYYYSWLKLRFRYTEISTATMATAGTATAMLFSLPLELIDMILRLVMKRLLRLMTTRASPISIIEEYRALLLVCKTFKYCLENSSLRIGMRYTAIRMKGDPKAYFVPKVAEITDSNIKHFKPRRIFTTWSDVFKVYQKVMFRYAYSNFGEGHFDKLGKFWLNHHCTVVDLDYIWNTVPEETIAELVLLLGRMVERRGRPPNDMPNPAWSRGAKFWIPNATQEIGYPVGNVVNAIKTLWTGINYNFQYIFSVRDWAAPHDPTLCGSKIAPEVKEWWIWPRGNDSYYYNGLISGYHNSKAWVLQMGHAKLYTNFEQFEQIGDFENCKPSKSIYQKCWVSEWPRLFPAIVDKEMWISEMNEKGKSVKS